MEFTIYHMAAIVGICLVIAVIVTGPDVVQTISERLRERRLERAPSPTTAAPPPRVRDEPAAPPVAPAAPPLSAPAPVRLGRRPSASADPMDAAPLPALALADVARATTILVVGSRGSGKSVLIRAIVGLKEASTLILDPHSAPGKWPAGAAVIGGGSDYAGIYGGISAALDEMIDRSQAFARGEAATFPPLLMACDELGSVISECAAVIGKDKDKVPPGSLNLRLLKEGRKFGVQWVAGAHGDTAASVGSAGDTEAFRQSFDFIVYTGAHTRERMVKAGAGAWFDSAAPWGETPEGVPFPLIVAAYQPTTGRWYALDMRPAPGAPTLPRPALEMGETATWAVAAPVKTGPGPLSFSEDDAAAAIDTLRQAGRSTSKNAIVDELRRRGFGVPADRWTEVSAVLDTALASRFAPATDA